MMMRASTLAVLLAIAASAGCGHTKSVESPSKANKEEAPKPAAPAPSSAGRPGEEIPVAESPAALFKPGGVRDIERKLAAAGLLDRQHETGKLDESTRRALRRFQDQKNLPATGVPDEETVKKLGLDPKQIFRSAAPE
jgi:peptidoglycan hydrolase-like protein with peptidoglycan-binding domain